MHLNPKRTFKAFACAALSILLVQSSSSDTRPLPEDRGALHLYQLLTRLKTTARLMQVVAHPDDEDGGMMTMESRGRGYSVLLFTVTRGEGGQNKFGAESSDELGILRTLELLEADKYYAVEQRFSTVVDFGFSKTAEETFNKWHGHDVALADLVRAIRTFRPDVLTSRFSGTPRDGHGNHEASGVLTREAFRAAGDPKRFPEQIKEGLLPWQAKKLYLGNPPRMFQGLNVADEDYTVKLDPGEYSPFLGMSYTQFGLEGLAHQTSQGTGGIRVPPGHRYTYYKLIDSDAPRSLNAHETDFFEGIDATLVGLAGRLGSEESKVGFLRPALESLQKHVQQASDLFSVQDPSACAPPLLAGVHETEALIKQIDGSDISASSKAMLLPSCAPSSINFRLPPMKLSVCILMFPWILPARRRRPSYFPRAEQTMSMAVPGQDFTLTARLYNRGKFTVTSNAVRVLVPQGWLAAPIIGQKMQQSIAPGESASFQFKVGVPDDAKYTQPYFTRRNPETETVYTISDPKLVTLPWPSYPVHAVASFSTEQRLQRSNGGGEN